MSTRIASPQPALAEFLRRDLQLDDVRSLDDIESAKRVPPGKFRSRRDRAPAPEEIITLVQDGDRLRWEFGRELDSPSPYSTPSRRAWWWNKPKPKPPSGPVVQQLVMEQLDRSQIGGALENLDRRLSPLAFSNHQPGAKKKRAAYCLRYWDDGGFHDFDPKNPPAGDKLLIFIHGTFSESTSLLGNGLFQQENQVGEAWLEERREKGFIILTFDHPTLSVSPMLNAMDLAAELRQMQPAPKQIDLVCHSRGGLVTRWFCEVFGPRDIPMRAVLVASPIAGTSLASAPRIRDFFDFLTNVGNRLLGVTQLASLAAPWLAAGVGLIRISTAITGGLASLPIADSLIALVPGLQAQARIGNNEEVMRLRAGVTAWHGLRPLRYFVIKSEFEPKDPGWNFLGYFRPIRWADKAVDRLFTVPNDLVVDCESMHDLCEETAKHVPVADWWNFGKSPTVHHCNYFVQPKTLEHLEGWLK